MSRITYFAQFLTNKLHQSQNKAKKWLGHTIRDVYIALLSLKSLHSHILAGPKFFIASQKFKLISSLNLLILAMHYLILGILVKTMHYKDCIEVISSAKIFAQFLSIIPILIQNSLTMVPYSRNYCTESLFLYTHVRSHHPILSLLPNLPYQLWQYTIKLEYANLIFF